MVSTRKTGIRLQNWIEAWVAERYPGAVIHNFKPTSKKIFARAKDGRLREVWVSQDQDLWNCIDLAVYIPGIGQPIFIQATKHKSLRLKNEKLEAVPWDLNHVIVQVWQNKGAGRWVITELDFHGELEKIGEINLKKYEGRELFR